MRLPCLILLIGMLGCRSGAAGPLVRAEASSCGLPSPSPRTDSPLANQTVRDCDVVPVSSQATERAELANLTNGPHRLTLDDAIRTALALNPDLVAARHGESVSAAALEVAQTYPFNPQVGVDVRPLTRDRNGDNGSALVATTVQQEFELAHQGRYREQAGAAELDRTRLNILQVELATTAATQQRFFTALYQRQRHELAKSLAELNQQMLESLERRFEAGQASTTDVSLARIQAGSSRQQAELARISSETVLTELRSQLGLPAAATLEPVGDLGEFKWTRAPSVPAGADQSDAAKKDLPDSVAAEASDQIARWAANRPDVRAAQADVDAARARLELACAARVPNIKAGPVYERDEAGTTFLGVEAQVALPILNTGNPLVRQRHEELHQRQASLEQLQLKARLEIQAAVDRYEQARRVTEQYSVDFTDGLTRDVRRIEDQFEAGQTDLLRVYSARTSMIQTRLTYLDSLHELARAAAAITAASGLRHDALLTASQDRQP